MYLSCFVYFYTVERKSYDNSYDHVFKNICIQELNLCIFIQYFKIIILIFSNLINKAYQNKF